MYWFGAEADRPWENEQNWKALRLKSTQFANTSISNIIDLLDAFSHEWKPESRLFNEALPVLNQESGFAPEEVHKTLSLLAGLLSRESLEKRLSGEFAPVSM